MRPLLSNSYVEFKDGQLPRGPLPSGLFVFIGPGDGTAIDGKLTPVSSPNEIAKLFGIGLLARDLTTFFLEGAGFAYAIQLPASTVGSVGALTVGQFTGLTASATVRGEWDCRGRITLGGALGAAQIKYSLDGGRTWGPSQVLRTGANEIVGPGNFRTGLSITPTAKTYVLDTAGDSEVSTQEFEFSTTAPSVSDSEIIDAMTSVVTDPSVFVSGFHVSHRSASSLAAEAFAASVATVLSVAESTWFKYLYAILQAPADATDAASTLAFVSSLRAAFTNSRVQFVSMPAIVKSMGGQFDMNLSPVICARRAMLAPQNDLGIVAAGQLLSVVSFSPGWDTSGVIGVDQLKNSVTIRKHVGAAGFYPTNGWMTDPSSDYSADKFRLVADLVASDVRTIGVRFVKIDVDPSDVEVSIQPLLDACKGPCDSRVKSKQASAISLTVPPNQNILVDKEVVVEVSIVPMGSADWIRFNVGFQSPFVGG